MSGILCLPSVIAKPDNKLPTSIHKMSFENTLYFNSTKVYETFEIPLTHPIVLGTSLIANKAIQFTSVRNQLQVYTDR